MNKELFDFTEYRKYLEAYLKTLPNEGYGQLAKIARAISLSPSTLTLVLQKEKDFTPEQANDLCEHLEFTELETEYFLNLVAFSRAGKPNLRARVERELSKIRIRSKEIKNRIPPEVELTEEAKAVFYSQWYYSGTRLLTSIEGFQTAEKIAEQLNLPRTTVKQVLDFLVSTGLCLQEKGSYKMGPQSTHLGADSSLISRHHQNWRLKAIERSNLIHLDELLFTSPVSISKKAFPVVRSVLINAVENCFKIIDPAPCEELACLNIDWFKI